MNIDSTNSHSLSPSVSFIYTTPEKSKQTHNRYEDTYGVSGVTNNKILSNHENPSFKDIHNTTMEWCKNNDYCNE